MTNTITPLNAFDDNYIWCISNTQQKQAVVVDPGDAQVVLHYLDKHGYELVAILVTHHHYDHTNGISELLQSYPNIPIYGNHQSHYKGITHKLTEGDCFEVLGQEFQMLAIPGHTLDHVAFYDQHNQQLFCGDTLFLAGCGRVFEGTHEQMHQSLQKIMALPKHVKAYPAHEYSLANLAFASAVEPDNEDIKRAINHIRIKRQQDIPSLPTSLAEEALINPFLRCHKSSVIAAAKQKAQSPLTHQADIFATLREWKNHF